MRAEAEGKFENTLTDALALAVRELLAMNGRPTMHEYQRKDMSLYQEHVRQWQRAKNVLAEYDAQR